MSNNPVPVTVHILDKEYRIACQPGEEEGLLASARFLDRKMRDIKSGGKVIGTDRVAVMAALNLAHELLEQRTHREGQSQGLNQRMRAMRERIEVALTQGNQLEL